MGSFVGATKRSLAHSSVVGKKTFETDLFRSWCLNAALAENLLITKEPNSAPINDLFFHSDGKSFA